MGQVQPICPFTNTFVCKWNRCNPFVHLHTHLSVNGRNHCSSMPSKLLCLRNRCRAHLRSHCAVELSAQACLRSQCRHHCSSLASKVTPQTCLRSHCALEVTVRNHDSRPQFEITIRMHCSESLGSVPQNSVLGLCSTLLRAWICTGLH